MEPAEDLTAPTRSPPRPKWGAALERAVSPFLARSPVSVGIYLRLLAAVYLVAFASLWILWVMTTERPEITVEGSDDGKEWKAYEFRHKPGDPARRPGFVAPHQPRLDWQMWFAALGHARGTVWFQAFLVRLLEGSEPVLDLLRTNPFPERPPRYVRALLHRYRFTTLEDRRATGEWWKQEPLRLYMPPISLRARGER